MERYKRVLWQGIFTTLQSHNISQSHWESVLLDALHTQRPILFTATNSTPHEGMCKHTRKSSSGYFISSWIIPCSLLVKSCVRNKYDPRVNEAKRVEINSACGTVRLMYSRATISHTYSHSFNTLRSAST